MSTTFQQPNKRERDRIWKRVDALMEDCGCPPENGGVLGVVGEEARAQLAAQPARSVMLGPIAARIGHRATNAAEAALELAHASEVARGRR